MRSIIANLFKSTKITSIARKMSTDDFKGVPLEKIYGGHEQWHLDHLPPIQHKRDHFVLFELPIAKDANTPPKPHNGEDKWDANHVKLPCAQQNEYKTESSSNPNRSVTTTRWEIIQTALLRDIRSSRELEQAILTYNPKYAREWIFKSLHELFELELDDAESVMFFEQTLPGIIRLALQLPEIVPCSIPLLKRGANKSISLSQQQIACLLANAFLCTFPRRNENSRNSEYASYPTINFSGLFQTPGDQNIEKIKCICNYFRRVCSKMPTGVVTFSRRSLPKHSLPKWNECQTTFADSLLHVTDDGTIEDDGEGLLQVDFANKYLGGGVLSYGCVQEEIRFMICPELLCSKLFTEMLNDNECLVMMGCERFSYYSGYASTFTWTGDYVDTTPFDESKRRKCTIVAIDAVPFRNKSEQYKEDMLERELNKAYIGFRHCLDTPAPGVATGNWGCGAFNGDKHLKSLLQLIACCETKRPLVYYTFGDVPLRDELFIIYEYLTKNKVKIADLWSCLLEYADQRSNGTHLYEFIIGRLQDRKERKPSTNGQCLKQANRFDYRKFSKPKPMSKPKSKTTSKAELKRTESDDDLYEFSKEIEAKQYQIEVSDSDDDDQFSMDETLEMLNKAQSDYRTTKPCATRRDFRQPEKKSMNESRSSGSRSDGSSSSENRPAQTIRSFFNDNQDKRPRSSLLDSLDEDFDRKTPAKMQRSSTASMINTPSSNSPEIKSADKIKGGQKVDENQTNDDSVCETEDVDELKCEENEIKDTDQTHNATMSEDLFNTEEDGGMVGSGYDADVSNVDQEKSQTETPLKSIDRQKNRKINDYFISSKRSNTSTLSNAQKKTVDDLNESSGSNQDKSPSDQSKLIPSREEGDSTPAKDSTEKDQEEQMDADTLLTDDESDKEVSIETDHMKALNVASSDKSGMETE